MADRCKRCNREKVDGKCPACGSPPKYTTEELISKTRKYIEKCRKAIVLDDNGKLKADSIDFPSIAGLSSEIELARSAIYNYTTPGHANYNKEFKDIIDILLADQERYLVERGLTGIYNSTITKLILTKHGYSDKQEIDVGEKTYEHIRKQREKYGK